MQLSSADLKHSLRQLIRSPAFTLIAILTLALGIGATTAIFTLVYDVLLRPLPYTHPGQLVVMQEKVAEFRDLYPTLPMNANHFVFWQQHSKSFQSMAVMEEYSMPLGTGTHPAQTMVLRATPGLFSVLDVRPQLGRAFTPQEAQPGHEHVAVLMYPLWKQQFQGDPAILGKSVTLDGFPYIVIGVMPKSFHLPHFDTFASIDADRPKLVEVLLPKSFSAEQLGEKMGDFNYFGLGRLNPGVAPSQANAEIDALQHTISASLSADESGTLSAAFTPLQTALVGDNRRPLLLLLAAVAGLLLVACVNITNLLLARAAGRRQQLAIAAALGASRARLLVMAVRETVLIAILGAASGIVLAAAIVPAMQQYLPPNLNFRGPLHLDLAGGAFAAALAVLATLLAGAASAWMVLRTDPQQVLHSESRLASQSRASKRTGRALVATEVAVSMVLVLLTGLLSISLLRLLAVDRGFQTDRILTATIALPQKSYAETPARTAFYAEVLRRLSQLPGVEHAAAVSKLPLSGDSWSDMIRVPGDTRPFSQLPLEHFRWISPGYFETIHLPLIAGRFLTPNDQGKNYVILSQRTARTLWPGKDPIGQHFVRGGNTDEQPFTVIGVVADARTISLAAPDPMMVYMPYWYRCDRSSGLLLRTHQDPIAMAASLRKAIWSVDPEVPVPTVSTLGGILTDSLANRRFEADLLLLFANSALLLAGLGVYGVVNSSVVQREREIGLRLALGAPRNNIYRLMLREGLAPVLLGAAIGMAVAFSITRLLSSLLFEVNPYDLRIAAAAFALLLTTGTLACVLPARRAASVDPMQALRAE